MKKKEFEFGFAPEQQEQEYRLYQVLLWTGLGIEKKNCATHEMARNASGQVMWTSG